MTFKEYQKLSRKTAIYPGKDKDFIYPSLGIAGEAGEIVEKVKHLWRDKNKIVEKTDKEEISKEMGDLLWYIAQLATELDLSLDEIASSNIKKLLSRKDRGTLQGKGDNR